MDTEQAEQAKQGLEQILRRRAPLILLCFVVVAGLAYGYSKHQTKKYTAVAALTFNSSSLEQQIAGLSASSTTINLLAQQNSNRELVKLGDMAARTAELVGHGLTEKEVTSSLSISALGETNIVEVAATSTSPALAAAIANVYTREFVKEQHRANRQYFQSALTHVKKQLAELPPAQRFGQDGLDLQTRAQTLSLLTELGYDSVEVAQVAPVPTTPSSPKVHSTTILGGVLGLLLGLGIAFLLERLDRRIKAPEDLETIYRLPMLGVVPKSAALSRSTQDDDNKRTPLPPAEAEAFNLIRAHLRFFNVDRDLNTVLITSATPSDGKTTVARHLAEAAARLGSRVLLVEADLRQPTLAHQLDILPGPGLADVLIGAVSIAEATQSVVLQTSSNTQSTEHILDVLAAGAVLPPNPGELIESQTMDTVLAQARSTYTLVVIDTPPLTAVSDAFPLLTKVDGVVIVGRVGHSRRDAAEQLQHVLASSGAPLLGVIANGSKSSGPSPYLRDGVSRSSSQKLQDSSVEGDAVPQTSSVAD